MSSSLLHELAEIGSPKTPAPSASVESYGVEVDWRLEIRYSRHAKGPGDVTMPARQGLLRRNGKAGARRNSVGRSNWPTRRLRRLFDREREIRSRWAGSMPIFIASHSPGGLDTLGMPKKAKISSHSWGYLAPPRPDRLFTLRINGQLSKAACHAYMFP